MPSSVRVLRLPGRPAVIAHVQGESFAVENPQLFCLRGNNTLFSLDNAKLLKICHNISKPKTQLQRVSGASRARVEWRSNMILNSLGIPTTKILSVATCLNPFAAFDSAFIMERLLNACHAGEFLADSGIDEETRLRAVDLIADDLEKMLSAGYALRDFRLGNIMMIGSDPTPVWIDNDAKGCVTRRQLSAKFLTTVGRVYGYDLISLPPFIATRLRIRIDELIRRVDC